MCVSILWDFQNKSVNLLPAEAPVPVGLNHRIRDHISQHLQQREMRKFSVLSAASGSLFRLNRISYEHFDNVVTSTRLGVDLRFTGIDCATC